MVVPVTATALIAAVPVTAAMQAMPHARAGLRILPDEADWAALSLLHLLWVTTPGA